MAFVDDIGLTEQPQKKEGGFVDDLGLSKPLPTLAPPPVAISATLPVEQTPEYETLIGLNYSHEEATRLLATVKQEPTNIRQFAQTPTAPAKSASDFLFRVVGESAAKTAVSLVTFPYDAVKSFEPASQKWYRGQYGEALDEGWQAVGQNIKGFAEFLGKPIGAADDEATGFVRFSWQKLKDAWGTDPVGSLVGLAGLWGLRRGSSDSARKEFVENLPTEVKADLINNFKSLSELPPEVLTKALEEHMVPKGEVAKIQDVMAEINGERIETAVVKVGDQVFEGPTHSEAISKALDAGVIKETERGYTDAEGYDLYGTGWNDLFKTNTGRIINRYKADLEFNVTAGENIAKQKTIEEVPKAEPEPIQPRPSLEKVILKNNPDYPIYNAVMEHPEGRKIVNAIKRGDDLAYDQRLAKITQDYNEKSGIRNIEQGQRIETTSEFTTDMLQESLRQELSYFKENPFTAESKAYRDQWEAVNKGDLDLSGFISEVELLTNRISEDVSAKIGNVTMPDGSLLLRAGEAPSGPKPKFDDPVTEARFQAATGVPKEPMWGKVKEWFTHVWEDATRTFQDLPRGPEFAQLQFDLLRLMKQKGVTSDRALRLMQGITVDLKDPALYDTFRRKVILDDLLETLEQGKDIPFGFTEASLKAEIGKLDTTIAADPKLQKAMDTRTQVWDAIKADYINAMKDIGFDVSERFKNQSYFRHQVLDYAQSESSLLGAGKKIKTPTSRGFLRSGKVRPRHQHRLPSSRMVGNGSDVTRHRGSKGHQKCRQELQYYRFAQEGGQGAGC